jgi:geranylgeranyl transferase type-2 subunit alpha
LDVVTILQNEWDYTTTKLHTIFSNCSAFHYRSKLLPLYIQLQLQQLLSKNDTDNNNDSTDNNNNIVEILCNIIQDEMDLISNAIFTEPDDQTVWWYQRFILDYMEKQQVQQNEQQQFIQLIPTTVIRWFYTDLIPNHIEQLRELQQEICGCSSSSSSNSGNGNGKWVLIGLLQTIEYYTKYNKNNNNSTIKAAGDTEENDTNANNTDVIDVTSSIVTNNNTNDERRAILHQLIQIDPDRINRYQSLLRKIKKINEF